MSDPISGFDPENIERIYLGEPALDCGRPIEDVLSDEQYLVASVAVSGCSYVEIAETVGMTESAVTSCLHRVYTELNLSSRRIGLAGFFPLDSEDPLLKDIFLSSLTPRQLEVVEGLTTGKSYSSIGKTLNTKGTSLSPHVTRIKKERWTDCENSTTVVRVANGIRANYARALEKRGMGPSRHRHAFVLPALVEHEPRIRRVIQRSAA